MNKRQTWNEEKLLELARKFKTKAEMRENNYPAIKAIRRRGLEEKAFAHMEILRVVKYTDEELLEVALKYDNRRDLKIGNSKVYHTIMHRENQQDFFEHMDRLLVKWTPELAFEVASLYTNRVSFARGPHATGYNYALLAGIIDDICGHMVRETRLSNVVYVWRAIGEKWNDKHVCKIGVTRDSSKFSRIVDCANKHGFEYELLMYKLVNNPTKLEKELLDKYEVVSMTGDGHTEFRALSDEDIASL